MVKNDLQVSESAIRALSLCIRKAYLLIFSPGLSSPNAYEYMQVTLSSVTRQNYFHSILNQSVVESFSTLAISKGVDILTSVNLSVDFLSVRNTTLIKVPNKLPLDVLRYEPIIFSSKNKIQQEDKIELSFIGYTLSKFLNYLPATGHVVLVDGRNITVKLSENIKKCLPSINLLQGWLTQKSNLPPVVLNKHCPYCEFQNICKV
ncbi:hypothetical protein GO003_021055 [Methylicorpusculum oleiharenae]|uniref:hypothetical protein n=1 Tax=Methylicorpusculum oleiharenae TaxID=1338687 RepID=UPI0013DDF47E|nr:hypothetical protein [Methylicorpusculum oleiharenae]MCD2452876.1 hypothetical protein [Methylicorpusculum oleiharenae]